MSSQVPFSTGNVFNARDLTTLEVARRFIPPVSFYALLGDSHCILEGPRGSGKTTLLRMLTPEAFSLWHETCDVSPRVNFIGIFVPADVRWAKQIAARLKNVSDSELRSSLQQAMFATAIGMALVDTIEKCASGDLARATAYPQLFFTITRSKEAHIVRALTDLWGLELGVPSFNGLRQQLRIRQLELGRVTALVAHGMPAKEVYAVHPYLGNGWLSYLASALQSINEVLERPEQRWAVLLDELEIVPTDLLESIVEALRSTYQNIRFKLALSPTGSSLSISQDSGLPNHGDDYRSIRLWYDNREDARSFAEQLLRAAIQKEGLCASVDTAKDFLEASVDEDEWSIETDIDRSATQRAAAFKSLYAKDSSFRAYIDEKGIDPSAPPIADSDPNGSLVRKITPLVKSRDQEISDYDELAGSTKRRGGRRNFLAYIGYPNILDLAEGNPRWILNLADALVMKSREKQQPLQSRGVQASAIESFVGQFVAKLKVYPISAIGSRWSPFEFVSVLGRNVAASIYEGAFTPEPRMSFILDKQGLTEYGEFVRTCIDLGALVIAKRDSAPAPLAGDESSSSLLGLRVRLTYRLAPHFRVPLRFTKEQPISSALKGGGLLAPAEGVEGEASSPDSPDGASSEFAIQQRLL